MVSVRESYRGFAVLRDARVFDPDASDGIVFGTRYLKVLQAAEAAEQQWSLRRGMVHELLHSRKQPFSGMDRPLLEYALVEVGGRVLTGFQAHMPASTDYIVRLDEEQLFTMDALWQDVSMGAQTPPGSVNSNLGSISSLLWGCGLLWRLVGVAGASAGLVAGYAAWVDMMRRFPGRDVFAALAERLELEVAVLSESTQLQLEGQAFYRRLYTR